MQTGRLTTKRSLRSREACNSNLAERAGFPACESADCTCCCWEGHSALCYTARGGKRKSYGQQSGVKPLDTIRPFFDKQDKRKAPVSSSHLVQSQLTP
jgi:hypothetical protein